MIYAIFSTMHCSMAKYFADEASAVAYGEHWKRLADGYDYKIVR